MFHQSPAHLKEFAHLIHAITQSQKENQTVSLLIRYFRGMDNTGEKDQAFRMLLDISPPRVISMKKLNANAEKISGFPKWIIERSRGEASNSIRALALLLRSNEKGNGQISIDEYIRMIGELRNSLENDIIDFVKNQLPQYSTDVREVCLKLLTGTFRSPVSRQLLIKSLAELHREPITAISLRLFEMGRQKNLKFNNLREPVVHEEKQIPDPFPKIITLDDRFRSLGNADEWKACGLRGGIWAQMIGYNRQICLWSEKLQIINDQFPELIPSSNKYDFRLLGQIIPENEIASAERLKSRLQKRKTDAKHLKSDPAKFEILPVVSNNIRGEILEQFDTKITMAKDLNFSNWEHLHDMHRNCRNLGFSGILIFQDEEADRWFFKKAPTFLVRAVLIYVEYGSNQSLVQSLTFGLPSIDHELVPITKVGTAECLIDLQEVIKFSREHTLEKFGPVRSVEPTTIYELHFDGVVPAARRKCGIKLINPVVKANISEEKSMATPLAKLKELL